MYHTPSLQTQYLADLIKQKKPVVLHMKDGRKLHGTLIKVTEEAIFFRIAMTEILLKKDVHSIYPATQAVS